MLAPCRGGRHWLVFFYALLLLSTSVVDVANARLRTPSEGCRVMCCLPGPRIPPVPSIDPTYLTICVDQEASQNAHYRPREQTRECRRGSGDQETRSRDCSYWTSPYEWIDVCGCRLCTILNREGAGFDGLAECCFYLSFVEVAASYLALSFWPSPFAAVRPI
ncbi:unnamed protein product, partial [Amoebophrya sp. A25]|eukprot:GSA25T00018924001.1